MEINSQGKNKILIASNYTITPIQESIDYWTQLLGISTEVVFEDYNQIFQHLLQSQSHFYTSHAMMNVILIRLEDWLPYSENKKAEIVEACTIEEKFEGHKQHLENTIEQFIEALGIYQRHGQCNMLIMLTTPSRYFTESEKWHQVFSKLKNRLEEQIKQYSMIEFMVVDDYVEKYKMQQEQIYDDIRENLGHIPYTNPYYTLLGTLIIRYLYGQISHKYKVIIVDCDQTLWGGVCGETSSDQLVIDGVYGKLHQFLLGQKASGMLLGICSKNIEEDVYPVFDRLDMKLKKEDFVACEINWENKAINIEKIAKHLGLGLNSFIFIDDNPVECSMMRSYHKEVLTIQWPEDDKKKQLLLDHLWELDHYSVTEEDLNRNKMMLENQERMAFKQSTSSFSEFIEQLDLQITFEQVSDQTISRVAQLTKRTNQFNFTTKRQNVSDINDYLQDKGDVMIVRVKDRFGDYGIVGIMQIKLQEKDLVVDNILLSCRVLGRGVEHKMIAKLGEVARLANCEHVQIPYSQTEKNKPVKLFIEDICRQCEVNVISNDQNGQIYEVCSKDLESVKLDFEYIEKEQPKQEEVLSEVKKSESYLSNNKMFITDELREKIVYEYSDIHYLYEQLSGAQQPQEQHKDILAFVKKVFSDELKLPIGDMDEKASLETYITESMQVVEITSKLMKHYKNVSTTFLYEASCIEDLVHLIIDTEYSVDKPRMSTEKLTEDTGNLKNEEIAIIGINGIFPMAKDIATLWNNLVNGTSGISIVPNERWDLAHYYDETGKAAHKSYSKWGGFIEEVDQFDSAFFSISKKEADYMDPQQRLLLQCVWNLLEDACYTTKSMPRDTGVFVGAISNDYNVLASEATKEGISAYRNSEMYQLANRISYHFDFHGPSMTLDTACSSSATALYMAYQCLKSGDCQCAIVGGVNLFLHPSRFIQYSQMKMQAQADHCCPFGEGANGTVFSEAVSAILLKPLSAAKKDHDHIYGVIKGMTINSGGKTNGFTVPNPKAQGDMIKKTLAKCHIPPSTIGYVEAHGTGTPLGDPIEVKGLTEAFTEMDTDSSIQPQSIALGSIKSNIGHSESAAALSGIIKALLQMKYQTIVPSLNAQILNHRIPFEKSPFFVPQQVTKWHHMKKYNQFGEEENIPLRASVSSFGAGGSNAYIILEEYNAPQEVQDYEIPLFVLSAKTEESLRRYAQDMKLFLQTNELGEALGSMYYSLQIGREQMKYRLAFVGENQLDIIHKLEAYLNEQAMSQDVFVGKEQTVNHRQLSLGDSAYDKTYLKALIHAKEYERIAALWVLGIDINWQVLYEAHPLSKINLPLYPFEKRRCWLPIEPKTKEVSIKEVVEEKETTIDIDNLCYLPIWERNNEPFTNEKQYKHLLIIYSSETYEFDTALEAVYRKASPSIYITKIRADEVDSLTNQSEYPFDCIYYISNFHETYHDSMHSSEEAIKLISVIKQMRDYLQEKPIDCFVVTKDAVRINDNHIQQSGAGLVGLAYAIAHSEYRLAIRNVDISEEDLKDKFTKERAIKLLYSMPEVKRGEQVKILGGIPYIQNFVRLKDNQVSSHQLIKQNGVYVLLGGTGTVGQILTRYLTDKHQAQVVWIGSSTKESQKVTEKLSAFRESQVNYYQCDVIDRDAIRKVIQQIRDQYQEIHGAIFMGQVISYDNSIYQTSEEEFKGIFEVKARGIQNFYEAFQDVSLDFMCIFSSAQAFSFSNAGNLSAYAAGITYADAYIKRIMNTSKFPLGIINWGFWKESAVNTKMSKNISALESEQGIACFLRFIELLQRGEVQQLVCINASEHILNLMNYKEDWAYRNQKDVGHVIHENWFKDVAHEYDLEELNSIYQHTDFHQWMVKLLFIKLYQMGFISFTRTSIEEAYKRAHILPKYKRLLVECMSLLSQYEYISLEEDDSFIVLNRDVREYGEQWLREWSIQKQDFMKDEQWHTKIRLFDTCIEHFEDILQGKVQATEIIFPNASMEMLEHVYKSNVIVDYFNTAVADSIVAYIKIKLEQDPKAHIHILEVGAGTGGTSAMVFKKLIPYKDCITYYYTDVSKAFLVYAKEKYEKNNEYIRYEILNAEQPIPTDRLPVGTFDIVLSTNCLHATSNINHTIRNVKSLLMKNGLLIVNEEVEKTIFTTLTFGLLDGWWLYQDTRTRIVGAPLLYRETWHHILEEEGFKSIVYPVKDAMCLGQQVIIGQSDGLVRSVFTTQEAAKAIPVVKKEQVIKGAQTHHQEEKTNSERAHVKEVIMTQLSQALMEDISAIDEDAVFYEYGIDSIIGITFIDKINKLLNISLNSAVLFDYVSVNQLVSYIMKNYSMKEDLNQDDDKMNHLEDDFRNGNLSVDDLILLARNEEGRRA